MNKKDRKPRISPRLFLVFLCILLGITALISISIGRYTIPPEQVIKGLMSKVLLTTPDLTPVMQTVLFDVRLPRIIAAILVGAGLSIAGASFQGVFRNPLVSPYILGVSSGAGFGAGLGILISASMIVVQGMAFAFGIIAVGLACWLSSLYRRSSEIVMVLAGMIVGAFFSSLISLVQYLADPYEALPAIVFWLMGSFSTVMVKDLIILGPVIIIASIILLLLRWRINVLSLGDEEAEALGVDIRKIKGSIIVCVTLISAASVSLCGIIGWVGLVVPHVARMFVGPDHRWLLPISFVIGATYLLVVDDFARTLTSAEIPLGILTALIGAPFFAFLLTRKEVGW
ncbi:MAG: iron ABC transporter permease [Methanolinea sp.]|jgi:iron complex transport system permease protein